METNKRCCVQCDNGGAGSLDDAPTGSAHGAPDWRADPDDVADPHTACDGEGCEGCDGTGDEPSRKQPDYRLNRR